MLLNKLTISFDYAGSVVDLHILLKAQEDAVTKAYALSLQQRDSTTLLMEENLLKYKLSAVRASAKITHRGSLTPDPTLPISASGGENVPSTPATGIVDNR